MTISEILHNLAQKSHIIEKGDVAKKDALLTKVNKQAALLFHAADYLPSICSPDKNEKLWTILQFFQHTFPRKISVTIIKLPEEYSEIVDDLQKKGERVDRLVQELEIFSEQKNWRDLYKICCNNKSLFPLYPLLVAFNAPAAKDEDYKGQYILTRAFGDSIQKERDLLREENSALLEALERKEKEKQDLQEALSLRETQLENLNIQLAQAHTMVNIRK